MLEYENMSNESLSSRFCLLSAGCSVDEAAIERRNIDLATLKKLGEAYRSGWLHNVLSRITPLTMRRKDDYLAMADVFVDSAEEANHVLDRFDADLELFCSVADITVTEHMSIDNVSDELRAHIDLYNDVQSIFTNKFSFETRDPINMLATSPIMSEATNPFIKEFIDKRFNR